MTRQSKRRFVRVNASRGVYSDKGVYLAGSFWGRRCVHGHEKPCWRASAAPGSALKRQGAARGRRFAEAVCQSKRPLPLGGGRAGARPTPRRPGPSFARVSAPHSTDRVNAPPAEPGAAFTLSCYHNRDALGARLCRAPSNPARAAAPREAGFPSSHRADRLAEPDGEERAGDAVRLSLGFDESFRDQDLERARDGGVDGEAVPRPITQDKVT